MQLTTILCFFTFASLVTTANAAEHYHADGNKWHTHDHDTKGHSHNMDPKTKINTTSAPTALGPNFGQLPYSPNQMCNNAIARATNALAGAQGNLASTFGQNFGGISPYLSAGAQAAQLYSQQLQQVDAARDQAFDAQERIDQEEFEQISTFQDQQHKLRKAFYQMNRELIKTKAEMNSEKRKVESACDQEAETQYAALVQRLNELSASGQFQARLVTGASGTRERMRRQKRIFRARCLAKVTTQNTLADIGDKYKAIFASLTNQGQEIQADIEHQAVKINQVYDENDRQRGVASEVHSLDTDRKISRLQWLGAGMQMFGQGMGQQNINPMNASFNSASAFSGVSAQVQEFQSIIQHCMRSPGLQQIQAPPQLIPIYQQMVGPCNLRCTFVPIQNFNTRPGNGISI